MKYLSIRPTTAQPTSSDALDLAGHAGLLISARAWLECQSDVRSAVMISAATEMLGNSAVPLPWPQQRAHNIKEMINRIHRPDRNSFLKHFANNWATKTLIKNNITNIRRYRHTKREQLLLSAAHKSSSAKKSTASGHSKLVSRGRDAANQGKPLRNADKAPSWWYTDDGLRLPSFLMNSSRAKLFVFLEAEPGRCLTILTLSKCHTTAARLKDPIRELLVDSKRLADGDRWTLEFDFRDFKGPDRKYVDVDSSYDSDNAYVSVLEIIQKQVERLENSKAEVVIPVRVVIYREEPDRHKRRGYYSEEYEKHDYYREEYERHDYYREEYERHDYYREEYERHDYYREEDKRDDYYREEDERYDDYSEEDERYDSYSEGDERYDDDSDGW